MYSLNMIGLIHQLALSDFGNLSSYSLHMVVNFLTFMDTRMVKVMVDIISTKLVDLK